VPALPSSILEPVWVQVGALFFTRQVDDLLGRQRPRIPDRVIFDLLIQVLVFGCGDRRASLTPAGPRLPYRQPWRWRE
jgi:hypothetical protein